MSKKGHRERTKFLAKLVTLDRKPCVFCQREVDDEITYGKLYSIGDIQCHYYCVLLSCCLVQRGKDEEGLFGFLYPDILSEVERSKKHRCSYCSKDGATLGCSVSQCRKQFHLPCGRERNAVSLFYGNYKSFCKNHAPKQKISENVMAKVKLRMQAKKSSKPPIVNKSLENKDDEDLLQTETVCVICYEEVECYPTPQTFWPPCCARDAWFHRSCVQRMALSAGMHYLKCPLCNDKENFYHAVLSQGFYVPDRDAAWELEQNAFAEIYEREVPCGLAHCACPNGRDHDTDTGEWDIKLCLLCGSAGAHAQCLLESGCTQTRYICTTCTPAAPDDLDQLATNIENIILSEQARAARSSRQPVMPCRMSLRRTKQRLAYYKLPTSSQNGAASLPNDSLEASSNTTVSRQELNLKTPKRQISRQDTTVLKDIENKMFSPVKMIEQGLSEKARKIGAQGIENFVLDPGMVESVRQRFRKPKPLCEKKKIVDGILDDLVSNILKEKPKTKEPVRAFCSPKKEFAEKAQQGIQVEDAESEKEIVDIKQEPSSLSQAKLPTELPLEKITTIKEENCENNLESDISAPVCSKDNAKSSDTMDIEDDSSTSTFELPPEFIAEDSNSLPIFDTPRKLKTVEIQKDSSMEISEDNNVVNIDLVKMENVEKSDFLKNFNLKSPVKSDKCAFKFSPTDKESLESSNMDIDIESFKNQYLNEVDRDFKCKYSHKHDEKSNSSLKLRTAIDFAIDAAIEKNKKKRKLKNIKKQAKKRKTSSLILKYENSEGKSKKVKNNKMKTEVSIQNDSMKVKISLKKQKFKLKIMQSKVENTPKTLKQYVLKYSNDSPNEVIGKPEKDLTPIKRKRIKTDKSPDNLIQTSIQSFFKGKCKE